MNKNDIRTENSPAPRDNRFILNKHNKPSEYYRIKNQLRSGHFTNPISSSASDLKMADGERSQNFVYLSATNNAVKDVQKMGNCKITNKKKGMTLKNISITVTDNEAGEDNQEQKIIINLNNSDLKPLLPKNLIKLIRNNNVSPAKIKNLNTERVVSTNLPNICTV